MTVHTFHDRGMCESPRGVPAPVFLETERRLARRTDLLVTSGPEIRDELVDSGVGREAQWRIVPAALEPVPARLPGGLAGRLRLELGVPPNACLAGAFARSAPARDHVSLIEAMRLAPGLHLVIGGESYEVRSALESEIRAAGIEGRIHLAGWWTELPGSMAEVDLVVVASRGDVELSSLLEAAEAGKAVVAAGGTGTAEVVRHDLTGLLVPTEKPRALANALRLLQLDEGKRRKMGLAARRLAARVALKETLGALRQVYLELNHVRSG